MAKKKCDCDVPVDLSMVSQVQLNFRAIMKKGIAANPEAVPNKYVKQCNAAMAAPLNVRRNAAQLRRAEAKARRYLDSIAGPSNQIGDWTSTPDWNTFFANLIALLQQLIPMFANCGA